MLRWSEEAGSRSLISRDRECWGDWQVMMSWEEAVQLLRD